MIDKNENPLDSIIDFAWAAGAERFWVNNAKDELKKLKQKLQEYENAPNRLCKSMAEKTNTTGA